MLYFVKHILPNFIELAFRFLEIGKQVWVFVNDLYNKMNIITGYINQMDYYNYKNLNIPLIQCSADLKRDSSGSLIIIYNNKV